MYNFLKKYLGDNFEKDLLKSEAGAILKPGANIGVLPQEMYISMQIVPRTVISLLVQHLKPLKAGQIADIPWPSDNGHIHNIHINKISNDLYSGEITGEGKVLAKFGYRSLPAVGLVIMSTYELYDKETNKQDLQNPDIDYDKVQKIIDERIRMQALVEEVVNKKLSEKEALQQLITQKIQDYLRSADAVKQSTLEPEQKSDMIETDDEMDDDIEASEVESEEEDIEDIDIDKETLEDIEDADEPKAKKSKLKEFMDKKVKKSDSKVSFTKAEISCPDCNKKLYKGGDSFNLCVCYGESYGQELKIKKSNGKYTFKFPKQFGLENAEMLLEAIKKK